MIKIKHNCYIGAGYVARPTMPVIVNKNPNIKDQQVFKITDYRETAQKADIIALLVAHNEFKELEFAKRKVFLDYCGVTNS